MELNKVGYSTYIWNRPVTIGIFFLTDRNAIIIDSGLDDSYSKKILKYFESNDLELEAIINTHSHADHCGGNRYLQEKTNCNILASRFETSIINNTELEPIYLYGAHPINDLNNKFLRAEKSNVTKVIEDKILNIKERKFEIIDLGGHSPGMIGITTEDSVTFIGDSLFDEVTIEKHKILYCMDLAKQYKTLERLKGLKSEVFISSHGGKVDNIEYLIAKNKNAYDSNNELILDILHDPKTLEDILATFTTKLGLKLNIASYYLNRSALSSHISYLANRDFIEPIISENKLYWRKNRMS